MTAEQATATQAELSAPALPDRRRRVLTYSAVIILFWMSLYLYVASLPTYVQSKGIGMAAAGLVLSMFGLWQALVRVPVGIAADWLGWRQPFILGGLVLCGIGAWIMLSSSHASGLIVGRALTGVAAGAWVPMVVAFSSLFPPKDSVRAAGFLILFQALGRIVASAANGPLNDLGGYSLAFYASIAVAALAFAIGLTVREPRRPAHRPTLRQLVNILLRKDVLLPSLLSALGQYVTWGLALSFIPLFTSKTLGGVNSTLSLLATLTAVTLAIGSFCTSSLANRFGANPLVLVSFLFYFTGGLVAAFTHSIAAMVVAIVLLGLGTSLNYPTLMGLSIRKVIDSERNFAMGLHQTVYAIGMFAGPALSGVLAQYFGIQRMFAATAVMAIVLGGLGTWALDKD